MEALPLMRVYGAAAIALRMEELNRDPNPP